MGQFSPIDQTDIEFTFFFDGTESAVQPPNFSYGDDHHVKYGSFNVAAGVTNAVLTFPTLASLQAVIFRADDSGSDLSIRLNGSTDDLSIPFGTTSFAITALTVTNSDGANAKKLNYVAVSQYTR